MRVKSSVAAWQAAIRGSAAGTRPAIAGQPHGSLDGEGMRSTIAARLGLPRLTLAAAALLMALSAVLALSARAARADVPKLVPYGAFVAEGLGIAVDSTTGDVYTAGPFSFCENAEKELEACAFGNPLHQYDEGGHLLSAFAPASFYTAAAVNPVNKDVYTLSAFGSVEEYDPTTGTLVSSFSVPPSKNFQFFGMTVVEIATDAAGDLYVPVVPQNEVLEYSETGTLLNTFTGTGGGQLSKPTGVAVDPAGDLWVADEGNNRIEELSPADAPLSEIKSEGVSSVALDSEGNVLALVFNTEDLCRQHVPPCSHLIEYSPSGSRLADVGAGAIKGPVAEMAANVSSGRVYITAGIFTPNVVMFGPPRAPEVKKALAVDVTTTGADLGALLNAGGLQTTYEFEYGTTTAYGSVVPAVEGEATGVVTHAVWASAAGLTPGTTYHFRIVAHNGLGTMTGEDQTFTTPAAQGACPNEGFRTGFSANLPDCRAYEMVTQPNKDSAEPDSPKGKGIEIKGGWDFEGGGFTSNHAARDGDRFAFWALEVMPESQSSGMEYLATRGEDGWSSKSLIPLESYDNNFCTEVEYGDAMQAFSSQLTSGVIRVGANSRAGTSNLVGNSKGGCNAEGLEVVPGEPLKVENLLMRNNVTDGYQLINTPPAKAVPTDAHFEGATADLSRVFFKETTRLTENGPAGVEGLYESDAGALRLVSVLPDGTAVAGSLAAEWQKRPSVVSADGSDVFFTAGGDLYERIDGERTVQLDKPQGGPGAGGGGKFELASADGTQAYFLDDASAGLTADTVPGSGMNLYRYADGQLTDLSASEHAEVLHVLGLSPEGVYFAAKGVLTSASNANGEKATAAPAEYNLYEWRDGKITFIVTPTGGEFFYGAWTVSPNGQYLAFTTETGLMGFDNVDQVETWRHDPEIYLYSAASKQLACVSCSPTGEAPSARGARLPLLRPNENESQESAGDGAPNQLTNGGRLFFQTEEALLPTDSNGQMDVYEYEDGQLHLISSGSANSAAQLLDVSEEGKDVFFVSRQPLTPQDLGGEGESNIIYDAREDGGFPYVASPPACTTAESCRASASPQPPVYGAPSSQTFSGEGNFASREAKAGRRKKAHRRKGSALERRIAACRRRFGESRGKRSACIRKAKAAAGKHRRHDAAGKHRRHDAATQSSNHHNGRGQ